jgi:hypothetical protein
MCSTCRYYGACCFSIGSLGDAFTIVTNNSNTSTCQALVPPGADTALSQPHWPQPSSTRKLLTCNGTCFSDRRALNLGQPRAI